MSAERLRAYIVSNDVDEEKDAYIRRELINNQFQILFPDPTPQDVNRLLSRYQLPADVLYRIYMQIVFKYIYPTSTFPLSELHDYDIPEYTIEEILRNLLQTATDRYQAIVRNDLTPPPLLDPPMVRLALARRRNMERLQDQIFEFTGVIPAYETDSSSEGGTLEDYLREI